MLKRRHRRSRENIFRDIYARNLWGDQESVSGPGSNLARTSAFRAELPPLLKTIGVRTLLDAPSGDFNWMREVELEVEQYIGVDIVPELVEQNQRRYGTTGRSFLHRDLVLDQMPCADAILCRDGLVHFPLADIRAALQNFKRSGACYLLTTTFTGVDANREIKTGEWRPINLQLPPFNFPPPLWLIDEKRRAPDGFSDKCLGLWRLENIAV
jgi:hypothetical protein